MKISRRWKLGLAAAGVVIAACAYLGNVTMSLRRERAAAERALAESEQIVSAARRELAALRNRDARITAEAPIFAWATHLTDSVPRPYLVETPLKFSRAIREQGFEDAQVQLAQLLPFPALPGYAVAKWEVHLPKARVFPFGEALAAIENNLPLGQLKSLAIQQQGAVGDVRIAMEFDTLVQP